MATPAPSNVSTLAPIPPIFGISFGDSAAVSADATISSQDLSEFLTTLVLNALIGLALLAVFEIKRNKRSVYAPRLNKLPHRAAPALAYGPLRWVWSVATMSGPETLRLAGMDAYCLVRFNYLCLRMCVFASFWGMLVLTPVYAVNGSEASGIYYLTLANVPEASKTLWAALVFAYLFTWHALYVLRGEHQVFAEMREAYLTKGDPDFAAQTRYTTKVENVPAELRSAVALEAYFDDLFPGQVHSAMMCLNMPELEKKVERREILADKLEKTRSLELAKGKDIMHRQRRFLCDCFARTSDLSEADFLAGELEKLNVEIDKEQKAFLRAAQRLNSMDDSLIQASGETGRKGGADDDAGESSDVTTRPASSTARNFIGKMDWFLRRKSEMRSNWALEEEEVNDDSAVGGGGGGQADEDHAGEATAEARGAGSPGEGGIDEESEARRRPSAGGVSISMPGPHPGSSSALEAEEKTGGSGSGGLMDSAPDIAKEALSSLAFVGNTAYHTTRRVARSVLYLTLGQRMSNTGFVTFRQMSACAASRQVLIAPRPDWCDCEPAPDPRDVVWANIAVPQAQSSLRQRVAAFVVGAGAIFWSIPVTLVQLWASFNELEKLFPWLSNLDPDSILYSLIAGYLPVVALLLLMLVLPFLFQMLAYRYERRKSHSEVQRVVLNRYFMYQVANIYVTVASGSIVSALEEIINNPAAILNILGETFPAVAVYFLDVIVVKVFAGLTWELLRGWPLLRVMWSQRCTNRAYATAREIRIGPFGAAELQYGWVYPTLLLVLVVCFVYAVISPFIMPAGAVFFAFSYVVYKHQVLYVYVPKYESGGVFWFSVYPRVLIGLALAQLTVAGYVFVREGYSQASLMLPLPVFIYWYGYRSYKRYVRPAESISMETAARTDRRGATAMAAAVKSAAEARRRKAWGPSDISGSSGVSGSSRVGEAPEEEEEYEGVNPDEFEPLLYAQLALTSPAVHPDDCRPADPEIRRGRLFSGSAASSVMGDAPDSLASSSGIGSQAAALDRLQAPLLGSRAAAARDAAAQARSPSSVNSAQV